ncbi:unnamed protein product [Camellia sinensis]
MFRQAPQLMARVTTVAMRCRRQFSTDVPVEASADSTFVEAWRKLIPNIEPPKTPSSFMTPRPSTPASIPTKLTVNFVLPYSSQLSNKEGVGCLFLSDDHWWELIEGVDMVIIPATTGLMGVLPGHVATIAELKPGVFSVHEGNEVTKYFVSSGFAFIHANSFADIIAVEAVPLDHIDLSLVHKGLADFTQKLNSASTDLEKAEAQIGVDVHSALNSALTG